MANIVVDWLLDGIDTFLAWLSVSLRQSVDTYCDLETADSKTCLVAHDGSLISVIEIHGTRTLIGAPEFDRLMDGLNMGLASAMSRPGHALQVCFNYDREHVTKLIDDVFTPAKLSAKRISLDLDDLFEERTRYLSHYCAEESVYFVLWTRPTYLSQEQMNRAMKDKLTFIRENKIPPFKRTQNILAAIPDLREAHESFVRSTMNDLGTLNIHSELLNVHTALARMRMSVDADFTDLEWKPVLPGDTFSIKQYRDFSDNDISDLMWPSLAQQILPRDAEEQDLRTVRIGDKIYSSVFIDLFPKDIKPFITLFSRTLSTRIPWRISFLIESDGLPSIKLKAVLSSVLAFSSVQNRLISDSEKLLNYIRINTDDAVVRLRVAASTWAPEGDLRTLRLRAAELSKAIQAGVVAMFPRSQAMLLAALFQARWGSPFEVWQLLR